MFAALASSDDSDEAPAPAEHVPAASCVPINSTDLEQEEWQHVPGKNKKTSPNKSNKSSHLNARALPLPEDVVLWHSVHGSEAQKTWRRPPFKTDGDLAYGWSECKTEYRHSNSERSRPGSCVRDCPCTHSLQEQIYHPEMFRLRECTNAEKCKLAPLGLCAHWHEGHREYFRNALLGGLVPGCTSTRQAAVATIRYMASVAKQERVVLVLRSLPDLLEATPWRSDRFGIGGSDARSSDASALLHEALEGCELDPGAVSVVWDSPQPSQSAKQPRGMTLDQFEAAIKSECNRLVALVCTSKLWNAIDATKIARRHGLWVRCVEFQVERAEGGLLGGWTMAKPKSLLGPHPSDWGFEELCSVVKYSTSAVQPLRRQRIAQPANPALTQGAVAESIENTLLPIHQPSPTPTPTAGLVCPICTYCNVPTAVLCGMCDTPVARTESCPGFAASSFGFDPLQKKKTKKSKGPKTQPVIGDMSQVQTTPAAHSTPAARRASLEEGEAVQLVMASGDPKARAAAAVANAQQGLKAAIASTDSAAAVLPEPLKRPLKKAQKQLADLRKLKGMRQDQMQDNQRLKYELLQAQQSVLEEVERQWAEFECAHWAGANIDTSGLESALVAREEAQKPSDFAPAPGSKPAPPLAASPAENLAASPAENLAASHAENLAASPAENLAMEPHETRFLQNRPNMRMWADAESQTAGLLGRRLEEGLHTMRREDTLTRVNWVADESDAAAVAVALSELALSFIPEAFQGGPSLVQDRKDTPVHQWDITPLCFVLQNCSWLHSWFRNYVPGEHKGASFHILKNCIYGRNKGLAHKLNENKADATVDERRDKIGNLLRVLQIVGICDGTQYEGIKLLQQGNRSAYAQQWLPLVQKSDLKLREGLQERPWLKDQVLRQLCMDELAYRAVVICGGMGTGKTICAMQLIHSPQAKCAAFHLCSEQDTAVSFVKSICAQLNETFNLIKGNLASLVQLPASVDEFSDNTGTAQQKADVVLSYARTRAEHRSEKTSHTIVIDALNQCPLQLLEVIKLIHLGLSSINNHALKLVCTTTDQPPLLGCAEVSLDDDQAIQDIFKFCKSQLMLKPSDLLEAAKVDANAQRIVDKVGNNFDHAAMVLENCTRSADIDRIPGSIHEQYLKHFEQNCREDNGDQCHGLDEGDADVEIDIATLRKVTAPLIRYIRACEARCDHSCMDTSRTISVLEALLALEWAPTTAQVHMLVQSFDTLVSLEEVGRVLNMLKPLLTHTLEPPPSECSWAIGREALQDWLTKEEHQHSYKCSKLLGHTRVAAWVLQLAAVPSKLLREWQPNLWKGIPVIDRFMRDHHPPVPLPVRPNTDLTWNRLEVTLYLLKHLALSGAPTSNQDVAVCAMLEACSEGALLLPWSEPFCLGCSQSRRDCDDMCDRHEAKVSRAEHEQEELQKQKKDAVKVLAAEKCKENRKDLAEEDIRLLKQTNADREEEVARLTNDIEHRRELVNILTEHHPCPETAQEPRRRESVLYAIVRDSESVSRRRETLFSSLDPDSIRWILRLVTRDRTSVPGHWKVSPDIVDQASNTWDRTALHHAAQLVDTTKLECLLSELDARPFVSDSKHKTPLHLAAQFGTPEGIRLLANHVPPETRQAYLCAKDSLGKVPLHLAANYDKPENIDTILELAEDAGTMVHQRCESFRTPLHWACIHGSDKAVEVLLEAGASVSVQDFEMWTPLHLAIKSGKVSTLQKILDFCQDHPERLLKLDSVVYLEGKPFHGPTVFCLSKPSTNHTGCTCDGDKGLRCPAVLCGLPRSFAGSNRHWPDVTADPGYTEVIAASVDRNKRGDPAEHFHGKPYPSLLWLASKLGHVDCVQALLRHDASVWALDGNHELPIFAAIRHHALWMEKLLAVVAKAIPQIWNERGGGDLAVTHEDLARFKQMIAAAPESKAKEEAKEAIQATPDKFTGWQNTIMLLLERMVETDMSVFTKGLKHSKSNTNPFIRKLFLDVVNSSDVKDKWLRQQGNIASNHLKFVVADRYSSLSQGQWPLETLSTCGDLFVDFEAYLQACMRESSEEGLQRTIRTTFLGLTFERAPNKKDKVTQPKVFEHTPIEYCKHAFGGSKRFEELMTKLGFVLGFQDMEDLSSPQSLEKRPSLGNASSATHTGHGGAGGEGHQGALNLVEVDLSNCQGSTAALVQNNLTM